MQKINQSGNIASGMIHAEAKPDNRPPCINPNAAFHQRCTQVRGRGMIECQKVAPRHIPTNNQIFPGNDRMVQIVDSPQKQTVKGMNMGMDIRHPDAKAAKQPHHRIQAIQSNRVKDGSHET